MGSDWSKMTTGSWSDNRAIDVTPTPCGICSSAEGLPIFALVSWSCRHEPFRHHYPWVSKSHGTLCLRGRS